MGNYFHLELPTKIFKPNSDPNYKPTHELLAGIQNKPYRLKCPVPLGVLEDIAIPCLHPQD